MASNPSMDLRTLLFGKVFSLERNEYVAVAWSFAYFFCVLSSYYILRPIREAMVVGGGSANIPYLFLATFIAMLVVTPIFGWVASRFPRRVFLPCTFVVWLSVFNLFVVSVFWSFMADIFTREQGRRLFGLISAGGSIGAIIGGIATSLLVIRIGNHNLFPISALLLCVAILCIRRLRSWVSVEQDAGRMQTAASGEPLGGGILSGITHAFSSKYFAGIAVASVIASLLGTALYTFSAQLVETAILDRDFQTRFFSNINIAQNIFTLLGQMFVVRHIVRRYGIGGSLAIMPLFSIGCV